MLTLGGYETTPPKPSQKLRVSGTEVCLQARNFEFLAQTPPPNQKLKVSRQTRNRKFLAQKGVFWVVVGDPPSWTLSLWVTPPPGLCIGHEPSLATFAKPETPSFWHGTPVPRQKSSVSRQTRNLKFLVWRGGRQARGRLPKPETWSFSPNQKLNISGLDRGPPSQGPLLQASNLQLLAKPDSRLLAWRGVRHPDKSIFSLNQISRLSRQTKVQAAIPQAGPT